MNIYINIKLYMCLHVLKKVDENEKEKDNNDVDDAIRYLL